MWLMRSLRGMAQACAERTRAETLRSLAHMQKCSHNGPTTGTHPIKIHAARLCTQHRSQQFNSYHYHANTEHPPAAGPWHYKRCSIPFPLSYTTN